MATHRQAEADRMEAVSTDPTVEPLEDQIEWYERESVTNQRGFKRVKAAQLVVAAAIPRSRRSKDSPRDRLLHLPAEPQPRAARRQGLSRPPHESVGEGRPSHPRDPVVFLRKCLRSASQGARRRGSEVATVPTRRDFDEPHQGTRTLDCPTRGPAGQGSYTASRRTTIPTGSCSGRSGVG
jgi:hypothetical protein